MQIIINNIQKEHLSQMKYMLIANILLSNGNTLQAKTIKIKYDAAAETKESLQKRITKEIITIYNRETQLNQAEIEQIFQNSASDAEEIINAGQKKGNN